MVPSAQRSDSLPAFQITRPVMNRYTFLIRTMSEAPLLVPLRGPKVACGTSPAHPKEPPS